MSSRRMGATQRRRTAELTMISMRSRPRQTMTSTRRWSNYLVVATLTTSAEIVELLFVIKDFLDLLF